MADVLVIRAWSLCVAAYGLDLVGAEVYDGYGYPPAPGHAAIGGGLLLAAALMWRAPRWGAGTAGLVAFLGLVGPVASTTPAFVMWVSLTLAVLTGAEAMTGMRVTVAVVYGFASLNKLLPNFLSGSVIAHWAPYLPAPRLLATAVVVAEAWLAVMVWRRWRHAPIVIVGFHVPVALGVAATPHHAAHLILYGVMVAVAAWLASGADAGRPERCVDVGVGVAAPDRPDSSCEAGDHELDVVPGGE